MTPRSNRRHWLTTFAGLGLASAGTWATRTAWAAPAAPAGRVILSITGQVGKPNAGAQADFDMDMIAALKQVSFTTTTPWHQGARRFTGPLLRDVLAEAGARGTTVRAIALNDYKVDVPFEDAQTHELILARLLDGKPMTVREKGPLFLVYPYDSDPELKSQRYYNRSAWQLRRLEVV
ncbi:hypothetical protein C7444_11966 [Sphaerotilus hippei]|uniref:Oxidoreductase molybdopterin-binding domain-containing protein n=1 Tax=Sphaerotilus hippei TaxID=744406 RepID=A0A318H768_9BURK|nr:molybdopterin-dependent oxidoreductase [Sphaerotilus hippei]PXW93555.1 hypothetical protein C7444_11966 [Sphaerotilus hippei]